MMDIKKIIQEELLKEGSAQRVSVPSHSQFGNSFPYLGDTSYQNPAQINPKDHYYHWKSFSDNQGMDKKEFPFDLWKKAIIFERKKNPVLNHFQIVEIVLDNLRSDIKFYDKVKIK